MISTLSNGLRVLTLPNENTKMVSVGVFVNVGSSSETKYENGISHFLEHMAFKGTKRRTYNKISSDAERLGAQMNAFTDRDMTAYFINGLSEHAEIFVDILGDIFCNSIFDDAEIEKERQVILQEYRMYADQASYVAHDLAHEIAFKGQAFGRKIIGEPANILSFQHQDFVSYIDQHYRGSNVIIGVSGNFSEDQVLAAVEKHFKKVKPSVNPFGDHGDATFPLFTGGHGVKKKAVEQCSVNVLFEAVGIRDPRDPRRFNPEYYAYEVACAAIGGGMSSPMFDEVREKRGLVYDVSVDADLRASSGVIEVSAGTTVDKIDEYLKTVMQVIQGCSEKIRPVDMELAKNSLCVQLASTAEKPFSTLLNAVSNVFTIGTIPSLDFEADQIRAVTPARAKKALEKILSAKKVVTAVGSKIDPTVLEKI